MRAPDTLVLLFLAAIFCAALSWVVPAGKCSVQAGADKQQKIDLASFEYAPGNKVGIFARDGEGIGILNLPFEGLVSGTRSGSTIGIAAFLLVLGGSFGMILGTGALERGLMRLIERYKASPAALFPMLFVAFSLGGAVFGMGEETIPFVLLLCPLAIRMGFDSLSVVLCTYIATQVGFATSWMNPFNVVIGQGIAGVAPLSGAGYRLAIWICFTVLGAAFTWWHATRVHAQPESSPSYVSDRAFLTVESAASNGVKKYDGWILLSLAAGMVWIIWGVTVAHYFLAELAAQFFAMALVISAIAIYAQRQDGWNEAAERFRHGAEGMLPVVLVIALAKAMVLTLGGTDPSQPAVLNTLLYGCASAINHLPSWLAAWLMLIVQSGFNFLVPSGSGQAALTMPVLAPLGDLVGVSRQVTVLAFQLGDGVTNLIVPTSAVLMAVLGAARVSWIIWARFAFKLLVACFLLSSGFVIAGVLFGYV